MEKDIDLSGFDEELNASNDIDLSGFDEELNTTPIAKTPVNEDQLAAPVVGYGVGKLAQSGLESVGSAIMQMPEKAARLAGGLTDEQVDYYKQNYKQMESGKGISQESVDEGFSRIENVFKGKNIEANRQRQLAEEALQVPFTKELAESSMSKALPKVMSKIDTEGAPFQNVLKDRITSKRDTEVARLTNLLEEKKNALIASGNIAKSKAEQEATKAAKASVPKKSMVMVKPEAPDQNKIYQETFNKTLEKYMPEQEKQTTKIVNDSLQIQKKLMDLTGSSPLETDAYQKEVEALVKERQTPLSKKYPSVEGYEDVRNLGVGEKSYMEGISDITNLENKAAMDQLRASRETAWTNKDDLGKAWTSELRGMLAPEGSESDVALKRTSSLLNELKEAQQNKFIERNIGDVVDDEIIGKFDPESVSIDKKQQDLISKIMNPSKIDMENPDIRQGRQILERLIADPKLVEQAKETAIKHNLIDPKKAFKFGAFDALKITLASTFGGLLPAAVYGGAKYAQTPTGAYKAATMIPRIMDTIAEYPKTAKVISTIGKHAIPTMAAGAVGFAAQAAEEGMESEPSGALPETIESDIITKDPYSAYWQEKGVRDPEEQIQRARAASFKQGIPANQINQSRIPGAYAKPEKKAYMESVRQAEQAGTLEKNYVEKITPKDDLEGLMNTLKSFDDKASQEYSNVLQGLANSTESQKEAVLFTLNQQPAFRQIVKKAKGLA